MISKNKFKILGISLLTCGLLILGGCKKAGKELSETFIEKSEKKVGKELALKATKESVENVSELSLKQINKTILRQISWDDLLKIIKKENLNLGEAITKMDGAFQKKLGGALTSDYTFFRAFTASKNTILDEFQIFTKSAPKAAKDINLLKWFAMNRDLSRRFGFKGIAEDIAVKEERGFITLVRKSDNAVLGELRDGVCTLSDPFLKGGRTLADNSPLKGTLIPNCAYKIKGKNGLSYLFQTDELGRLTKIEGKGITPNEISENIIYLRKNMNLGEEWNKHLKTIRQHSKGDDVDFVCQIKYAEDGTTPTFAKIDAKVKDKKIVSQSFENLDNVTGKTFKTADNAAILDKIAGKTGLSGKKKADLLSEMNADEELAKLIHSDPEFNVKRWLNTRNHVDKTQLARTSKGRIVPNGETYAGNVYYFNPHLNSKLKSRVMSDGYLTLKNFGTLSYEDLLRLDKLYPDGVPFTKQGFPDFSKVAVKGADGKTLRINIGKLSGDSKKDINAAETIYQRMGHTWEAGYTWHHVENSTELIRVPTAIHQLVDHAGGMSTHATEVMKQAA